MSGKQMHMDAVIQSSGVRFGTSGARGLVSSMSDEVCYAYTAAFLQAVMANTDGLQPIVLGHDLRPSSPRIAAACAAAIRDSGRAVMYAGVLPTPALAEYALHRGAAAIVVTGSHIPFDRNGIKFYGADGEISKADEQAIQEAVVFVPDALECTPLPAPDTTIATHYVQRYVDFFGADRLHGLSVAVYEHSSAARDVLKRILEALGAQVISLGRTNDFVPIDTEAVRPEDKEQARQWAKQYSFDAILSTDGDADRPLIGDETGQWLRGDVVGVLCARFLKADIVVTPVSSNTIAEKSAWFAQVVRTRIGSPYVIAAMDSYKGQGVVAGYEANGGFLLGSDVVQDGKTLRALPTRDAVLPMLALLCMADDRQCSLSALLTDLPARYTASDRLQGFSAESSARLLELLQHDHDAACSLMAPDSGCLAAFDITDGFRATFSNGDIVHVRPSGNAPELRCYAEADTQAAAQQLVEACLSRIAAI